MTIDSGFKGSRSITTCLCCDQSSNRSFCPVGTGAEPMFPNFSHPPRTASTSGRPTLGKSLHIELVGPPTQNAQQCLSCTSPPSWIQTGSSLDPDHQLVLCSGHCRLNQGRRAVFSPALICICGHSAGLTLCCCDRHWSFWSQSNLVVKQPSKLLEPATSLKIWTDYFSH